MEKIELEEARSGADLILDTLLELGISTIFGYPGGAVLPLYDAIYKNEEINHILSRHEQGLSLIHIYASYQEVAKLVLSAFLDDFTEEELDYCITNAYDDKFDTAAIAPVVKLQNHYNLELFHGPTIAFKDMALSILPYLLTTSAKKQGVDNKIVILTATSGDTGKAAMAGFADVPETEIIVFYPKDGVSKIQELQMTTQAGANTHVIAIDGNFDDAQTNVKRMFNDVDLREKLLTHHMQFSSANSMNIGRLVPQVVYYVYAYAQLVKAGHIKNGDKDVYKRQLEDSQQVYVFGRYLGDQKLLVLNNFYGSEAEVGIPEEYQAGCVLLSNYDDAELTEKVSLKPYQTLSILVK